MKHQANLFTQGSNKRKFRNCQFLFLMTFSLLISIIYVISYKIQNPIFYFGWNDTSIRSCPSGCLNFFCQLLKGCNQINGVQILFLVEFRKKLFSLYR